MELQQKTSEIAYKAYKNIDFVNKLKKISLTYDFKFENRMKKMDKKENLKILKELGYNFKIFTPGQHYNLEESFGDLKLVLSCKISEGIINNYIYIYIDGSKIDYNLYEENLAFIYRYLLNDMEAVIMAPLFRNYNDFRNAMSDIISIYEDFKTEFLKLLKKENLLEENTQ